MSRETQDILFGVAVFIPFMVAVFFLGWAINRFKNRRFTRAWAPLVPIIGGKITEDGGGASTSWLSGTWRGRRVWASMTPGRALHSGESGVNYNEFEAAVLNLPGRHDWRIEWKPSIFGFGREGWQIETSDPGLEERLRAAGAMALVERMGFDTVTYKAREKNLRFSENAGSAWVPTPGRFQEELDVLLQLAEIQEKANPAHP